MVPSLTVQFGISNMIVNRFSCARTVCENKNTKIMYPNRIVRCGIETLPDIESSAHERYKYRIQLLCLNRIFAWTCCVVERFVPGAMIAVRILWIVIAPGIAATERPRIPQEFRGARYRASGVSVRVRQ